jgi:hypothetical protein
MLMAFDSTLPLRRWWVDENGQQMLMAFDSTLPLRRWWSTRTDSRAAQARTGSTDASPRQVTDTLPTLADQPGRHVERRQGAPTP